MVKAVVQKRVEHLSDLARTKGLDLVAFNIVDFNHCMVKYHSMKKAGPIPLEEYCRDRQDYLLRLANWTREGMEDSPIYDDFDSLFVGEMRRLNG